MKSEETISKKLQDVKNDPRLIYSHASVFTNARLALVQHGLETTIDVLTWVLQNEPKKDEAENNQL